MKQDLKPKTRYEYDVVHRGLGFPVVLKRVGFVPYGRNDEIVLVDHRRFMSGGVAAVVGKPTRLTGREVYLLRCQAEMTLAEFGRLFDVSHAAVKKWENKKDAPTGMGWSTELAVRLYFLHRQGLKPRAFRRAYEELAAPRPAGRCTIHLDLDVDPPAIEYELEPAAAIS